MSRYSKYAALVRARDLYGALSLGSWSHCDLCGTAIDRGDKFVVLAGNGPTVEQSTSYHVNATFLKTDGFPPGLIDWWCLCHSRPYANCNACPSPATTCLHFECCQLFMRNCTQRDCLDTLWLAMVWGRRALTGGGRTREHRPRRLLPPPEYLSHTFQSAVAKCGLPGFAKLPQELRDMIEPDSENPFLSRYVTVLEAAWRLCDAPLEPVRSVTLSRIAGWTRGSPPRFIKDGEGEPLPVIRCTIDDIGLEQIERLPAWPPFERNEPPRRREKVREKAFIVNHHSAFRASATVQFKSGFCRLNVPHPAERPRIWNTHTPPGITRFALTPSMCETDPSSICSLSVINLDTVTGLTFIVARHTILDIHAHTEHAVSAAPTAAKWSDSHYGLIWQYVPLPPGERLLGLGVQIKTREGPLVDDPCYLLRMRLAGDITIGRSHENRGTTFAFIKGQPSIHTIVYDSDSASRFFMTPYCNQNSLLPPAVVNSVVTPWSDITDIQDSCGLLVAHASLLKICRISVFEDPSERKPDKPGQTCCRGLLFEYGNGAQRSLGHCQLHVDPVRTYDRPQAICIGQTLCTKLLLPWRLIEWDRIRFTCSENPGHTHEPQDGEWECFTLTSKFGYGVRFGLWDDYYWVHNNPPYKTDNPGKFVTLRSPATAIPWAPMYADLGQEAGGWL